MPKHYGACHCGQLKFEFDSAADVTVYACNCSICRMTGFRHLIIPARDFVQTEGEVTTYTFNTETAKHTFCPVCGVKPFYVPRSNPDGISIHFECVDRSTFGEVLEASFDGENWEANAATLSHLSD